MTKTNIKLNGVEIRISANCKGVANPWGDNLQHYEFNVTISANGERTSFKYYDSFANWQKGITELSGSNLLNCLDCFLSDASCYDSTQDFVEFCNEFGYESISQYKQAMKAFNGCKRHYNAAIRLFGSDWYDVANALREEI